MKLEEELRLSFYKEIASVNERHGVKLVQHADTGKIYVKKTLERYDKTIFEKIRDGRFTGVPVIKELIEADGSLIVIEDYISGHSVDELLGKGPFTEEETIRIISDLCDILAPFHSSVPQIVHRDIKGSNVIIDNEGKVYLIDFDSSKIVVKGRNRDTELIGTEEYAAPEQYGFGQSDQRTDIYALGILMNKMLTGKFPSDEMYNGDLSRVIKRATAIDPENRYQNVQEFKTALNNSNGIAADRAAEERSTGRQSDSGGMLKRFLAHLPYPVRELPGFRSGQPLFFWLALEWYVFLFTFGFFMISENPDLTPAQNRFYDFSTFLLLLVPTLYSGNYLGIRDRLPWKKSQNKAVECARLITGVAVSVFIVIVFVTVASMILHM